MQIENIDARKKTKLQDVSHPGRSVAIQKKYTEVHERYVQKYFWLSSWCIHSYKNGPLERDEDNDYRHNKVSGKMTKKTVLVTPDWSRL